MTARRQYPKGEHPYGPAYKRARAALLAGNPPCWWCGRPATTADHEPPLHRSPGPHLNLVPACAKCNYGRHAPGRELVGEHGPYGPSREW